MPKPLNEQSGWQIRSDTSENGTRISVRPNWGNSPTSENDTANPQFLTAPMDP